MVKVQPNENHDYYLDGYLKANTDAMIRDVTKKNYDGFVLIVGREGFGKSTLAMQLAMYVDPTFNLNRVVFTAEQFLEEVEIAEKYQAIVFDETMGYLSSRGAMSKFNKTLIKVMSEMRSKNLFVFLCIPNFFMMDWYVAQHRTTGLLYVRKRGVFSSYDYPTKKKLYREGKRYHSYHIPPNFFGKFVKYFPLDIEKYEAKKQDAINQWVENKKFESKWKEQRDILINKIVNEGWGNQNEVCELIGISSSQMSRICSPAPIPAHI
jgi:energy-coupling factor transporter ATP-binding protein EcfA2